MLVGDAAVTPHPDTGSGWASGFRGFEVLKDLLEALADTNHPKDEAVLYQHFNDRYELHVSLQRPSMGPSRSLITTFICSTDSCRR